MLTRNSKGAAVYEAETRETHKSAFPVAIITAVIFACYFCAAKAIYAVDQIVVPFGDAFTYTIFMYRVLNVAEQHIIDALGHILYSGNYNWLQDFTILVMSPILFNERSSIILINYLAFYVSALIIFRTALKTGVSTFWSFIVVSLFIVMPWNFHAKMEFNLTSLMPEPMFVNSMTWLMFALAWFLADPRSLKRAALCGIALSACAFSRGNALPYIVMAVTAPAVILFLSYIWPNRRLDLAVVTGVAMAAAIFLAAVAVYFHFTLHSILNYYTGVATSALFDIERKIAGSIWILLNMPGLGVVDLWYLPHVIRPHPYVYVVTALCHLVIISAVVIGVRGLRSDDWRRSLLGALGVTGAVTFYFDLIFGLMTFSGYYSDLDTGNGFDMHSFEPCFVGLIVCFISLACSFLSGLQSVRWEKRSVYLVIGSLVAWSSFQVTSTSFALQSSQGRPFRKLTTAREMKSLASELSRITRDASIYFFWYGIFNSQIMEYYNAQSGEPNIRFVPFRTDNDRYFWVNTYNPEVLTPKPKFEEFVRYVFKTADYIVIPENVESMLTIWPSATVAYRHDLARLLNSPEESPEYLVWAVVSDPKDRILILKRHAPGSSTGGLDVFPRDWGSAHQQFRRKFAGAIQIGIDPYRSDQVMLLGEYRAYNILRARDLYVGVARDLGPVDVAAVLSGATPRPPERKVVIGEDEDQVKKRIDQFLDRPVAGAEAQRKVDPDHLRFHIANARSEEYPPDRAFDNSAEGQNFWEAYGQFPMELTIELSSTTTFASYGLAAGDMLPARMPSSWVLEGSADGSKWITLDSQQNVPPWKPRELRTYPLRRSGEVRELRFRFLSGFDPQVVRIYEIELH